MTLPGNTVKVGPLAIQQKLYLEFFSSVLAEEYQPPYYDRLCHDPPLEEVKKIICDEKYRPQIPQSWLENEVSLFVWPKKNGQN